MKTILKAVAIAAAATLTMSTALNAQARGPGPGSVSAFHGGGHGWNGGGWGHRGGFWRGGYFGPGLALGLGIGALAYYGAYGPYGYGYGYDYDSYYAYPGYGVAPSGEYLVDPPVAQGARPAPQAVPLVSHGADPIFYPKNGQTAAKTETDRQDCNRWATTQAGAMNDASIFQRATFACMEGRGYVVK
jgi:hypothetical protein